MNNEKKIFSLNLIAYILCSTGIEPEIYRKENEDLFYAIFPENEKVGKAILEYRNPDVCVELHTYLSSYEYIRNIIAEKRKCK